MKKSIVLLLHVGYWMVYLFLFGFLYYVSKKTTGENILFNEGLLDIWGLTILTGIFSFYAFYFLLVSRFLAKKRFFLFIGWGIMICVAAALIPTLLLSLLTHILLQEQDMGKFVIPENFIQKEFLKNLMPPLSFLALLNGILATIIKGFITWYNEIQVKTSLEKKNLQTELELLKARINPHFLFNTLNNIDILIERDPKAASGYLQKLSGMMRFLLYEVSSERIALRKELSYIEQYIELQKLRTSNEQYIKFEITGDPDGLTIAPMLFLPFIENAFKHATNKKAKDAIHILIAINKEQIHFKCVNVFNKKNHDPGNQGGLGIDIIKQRLELLYKDQYQLDIRQMEDLFTVNSIIRFDQHELHHH